jgi:hypothetical protein
MGFGSNLPPKQDPAIRIEAGFFHLERVMGTRRDKRNPENPMFPTHFPGPDIP